MKKSEEIKRKSGDRRPESEERSRRLTSLLSFRRQEKSSAAGAGCNRFLSRYFGIGMTDMRRPATSSTRFLNFLSLKGGGARGSAPAGVVDFTLFHSMWLKPGFDATADRWLKPTEIKKRLNPGLQQIPPPSGTPFNPETSGGRLSHTIVPLEKGGGDAGAGGLKVYNLLFLIAYFLFSENVKYRIRNHQSGSEGSRINPKPATRNTEHENTVFYIPTSFTNSPSGPQGRTRNSMGAGRIRACLPPFTIFFN